MSSCKKSERDLDEICEQKVRFINQYSGNVASSIAFAFGGDPGERRPSERANRVGKSDAGWLEAEGRGSESLGRLPTPDTFLYEGTIAFPGRVAHERGAAEQRSIVDCSGRRMIRLSPTPHCSLRLLLALTAGATWAVASTALCRLFRAPRTHRLIFLPPPPCGPC